MALSPDQLRVLGALADQWPSADAPTRSALRHLVKAQGTAFEAAFEAMTEQLDTSDDRTLLPTLSEDLRRVALSASMSLSTAPPPGERHSGQHVGPYRLVKELGRGGMGVVWLAERADGQHTRQVALKMPLVENLNWLLAARFARERNILASLEHPRIARLYDAGMEGGTQPYIAIEYVRGIPITDFVKTHKLRPEAVVALFTQVIEAVAHAHTQLVIHRDIKPSNILVDARGEPHLLDFGIAKLLDDDAGNSVAATQLTQLIGRALTLDYASPEQVNNAALSTATDVYSLGVVLYELLTGSRPYHPVGPSRRDLEQAILDQDAPKPSEQLRTTGDSESGKTARRIRGDLDTIVLTALRKDPRQRYASAQAFADDLKRYLAFEPIQARPASATYKLRKWLRRHRAPLAIAAMGCVAVAAIGVRAWQQQQIAQDSQTQAKAVGGLLQSVFKGMSPDVAAMHQFTAEELLGRAQSYLETDKQMDAAAKRAAALQIAKIYWDLGADNQGIVIQENERKLAAAAAEVQAEAMANWYLADMYTRREDMAAAQKAIDRMDELVRQLPGPQGELQARVLIVRAQLHSYKGEPSNAATLYANAKEILQKLSDADLNLTLWVLDGEAVAFRDLGNFVASRARTNEAIAISKRLSNASPADDETRQARLCELETYDESYFSARKCLLILLPTMEARVGTTLETTREVRLKLAETEINAGLLPEARHTLARIRNSERQHPLLPHLSLHASLLDAYLQMYDGRPAEALPILEHLIASSPANKRSTLDFRRTYADALIRAGRTAEALQALTNLEMTQKKLELNPTENLARNWILQAVAIGRTGDLRRSVELLNNALEILAKVRSRDSRDTLVARAYRSLFRARMGKPDDEDLKSLPIQLEKVLGWQAGTRQLTKLLRDPIHDWDIRRLALVF